MKSEPWRELTSCVRVSQVNKLEYLCSCVSTGFVYAEKFVKWTQADVDDQCWTMLDRLSWRRSMFPASPEILCSDLYIFQSKTVFVVLFLQRVQVVLFFLKFSLNKSYILLVSDLVMQPHLANCRCAPCRVFFFLPLFNRKHDTVVNILPRTSGNQPLELCFLTAQCYLCVWSKGEPASVFSHRTSFLISEPSTAPPMVLMYVKPPPHQCLFIYVNLSQRVPAVTSMSVSSRFLKPMIFNTTAQ